MKITIKDAALTTLVVLTFPIWGPCLYYIIWRQAVKPLARWAKAQP